MHASHQSSVSHTKYDCVNPEYLDIGGRQTRPGLDCRHDKQHCAMVYQLNDT